MRRMRTTGALLIALVLLGAGSAQAESLQPIGKFADPIYVTSDPNDPDHLFVAERDGRIQLVVNGKVSLFADLRSVVQCGTGGCTGESGLASIAPGPEFAGGGRLYVDYANEKTGELHVAELKASATSAPIGTLRNVLTIPHPEDKNHNGGQLQFGRDGYLYVSTGDGGGPNDKHQNAQNLGVLLGKILRIDPRQSGLLSYTVPPDNPFVDTPGAKAEIWSLGLRNPFRFSFDRLGGGLVIADVGQEAREEIDFAPAPGLGRGANHGWNCREGLLPGPPPPAADPECASAAPGSFVDPVFDYPRTDPGTGAAHGCAVIGGYVVRDPGLRELTGRYLYGDLCTDGLRSLDLAKPASSDRAESLAVEGLNSFGEDSCGRVYTVAGSGEVSRIVGVAPSACGDPPPPPLDPPGPRNPNGDPAVPRLVSYLGIKAGSRSVPRGRRAFITAWVSPCEGRRGEPVDLWRGRQRIGTRHLDRVCSVRFRPRIGKVSRFHATIKEGPGYFAADSRALTIRPTQPKQR
jgi:hypothetical protein